MTRSLYALPFLLAACVAPAPVEEFDTSASSVAGTGQRYDCDTGATLFAQNEGGSVIVSLDNGTNVRLQQIDDTLPGTRFAGDGFVWFVSGDEGVFTDRGGQMNCRIATTV